MDNHQYQAQLAKEAQVWGEVAARESVDVPPDWRYQRLLRHNLIMHTRDIDRLLERVHPGMQTLELGCHSGWLTLAMAQRGAHAEGLDISEQALAVGRAYYEQIDTQVRGSVDYRYADLNALELPAATYDVIAVKGTLHHLVELERVIQQVHQALKPGGLFWVCDTVADEHPRTVLAAGAFTFLLPTHTSYRDKFKALARFGLNAPSRVKASMEAEGLSPFEGAGRDHDWLALVKNYFSIEQEQNAPAFTGYVTAQVALPDRLAVPMLQFVRALDNTAVRLGLLKNSMKVVYARRK